MISLKISDIEFFQEYFESKYLLVRGGVNFLPDIKEVDVFLDHSDPGPPFVRMFSNGLISEHEYIERYEDAGMLRQRVLKDRLYDLIKDGATMVLNRIDIRSRPIRILCDHISRITANATTANAYVAINGSGSFGKHWDTHDVFVVQLEGRKRWRIFDPTWELPLRHQVSKDRKQECAEIPVFDEVLEKGDLLYIPRGWWHCADPIGEVTFHIAIGTHGISILDYLMWACSSSLAKSIDARRSLLLNASEGPKLIVEKLVKQLSLFLDNDSSWKEFQQTLQGKQRSNLPFSIADHISTKLQRPNLDVPLRLNTYHQNPVIVNGFRIIAKGTGARIMEQFNKNEVLSSREILEDLSEIDRGEGLEIIAELLRREILEKIEL